MSTDWGAGQVGGLEEGMGRWLAEAGAGLRVPCSTLKVGAGVILATETDPSHHRE